MNIFAIIKALIQGDEKAGRISESDREVLRKLRAWWEGVEYVPPDAIISGKIESKISDPVAAAVPTKKPVRFITEEELDAKDDELWPSIRITLAQQIWGDGFFTAGGSDFTHWLARSFAPITKDMVFLDANAGLGGGMVSMAQKFDVVAHGYEASPQLLRAGKAFMAKIGAQIMPLRPYDLHQAEFAKQTYDLVLLRELLFRLPEKANFIHQLCDSLKDRGQLVITDFVKAQDRPESNLIAEWKSLESADIHVWLLNDVVNLLKSREDIEVRAVDDITPIYTKEISGGWKRYLHRVDEETPDSRFLPWILKEVRIWAKRVELLQSGEIRLYRIYARRKPAMERRGAG